MTNLRFDRVPVRPRNTIRMVIHAGSTHRLSTTLRRYVVIALVVCLALPDVFAQVSSNTCGTNAANKYPVNNTCVNRGFNVPTSYTATYNPGGCNAGANFDGYGWFTATSTLTTVRFTQHGIGMVYSMYLLHVAEQCWDVRMFMGTAEQKP